VGTFVGTLDMVQHMKSTSMGLVVLAADIQQVKAGSMRRINVLR